MKAQDKKAEKIRRYLREQPNSSPAILAAARKQLSRLTYFGNKDFLHYIHNYTHRLRPNQTKEYLAKNGKFYPKRFKPKNINYPPNHT